MRIYPFLAMLVLGISCFISEAMAASPAEEARFLSAVTDAFQKDSAEALVALTCWDRVPDKIKERSKKRLARDVVQDVLDIRLTEPDPNYPDLEWKDAEGVAYRSNLPVVKQVKITFAPGAQAQTKIGKVKVRDVVYPVGEKNGKLFLLEPAPVQKP